NRLDAPVIPSVSRPETASTGSPFSKHAPGMGVRLRATPDDRPTMHQRLLDRGRAQRFRTCINAPITELVLIDARKSVPVDNEYDGTRKSFKRQIMKSLRKNRALVDVQSPWEEEIKYEISVSFGDRSHGSNEVVFRHYRRFVSTTLHGRLAR
ncbi:hypothetical protein CLF_107759, partial [Clonorchis sinensis]